MLFVLIYPDLNYNYPRDYQFKSLVYYLFTYVFVMIKVTPDIFLFNNKLQIVFFECSLKCLSSNRKENNVVDIIGISN